MRRYSRNPWKNAIFSHLVPALIGCGCAAAMTVIFAAVTFYVLGTMDLSGIFTAASLGAGSYISGIIYGRYSRRRGMAGGMACGLIMYGILTIAAVIAGTAVSLWKPILLSIAGAIGGIRGVNTKRPKNLM